MRPAAGHRSYAAPVTSPPLSDDAAPGPTLAPPRRRCRAVIGALSVLALVAVAVLGYVVIERVRGGPGIGAAPTGSTVDLGSVTTAATTSAGVGGGWAPEVRGRTPLRGFGEVAGVITAPDGGTYGV